MSDRNKAFELQERLQENGISDTTLLEFLINNWMTGADALEAMQEAVKVYLDEEEEEDEDEDFDSIKLEIGMEVEVVDENCNECVLEYQDVGTITDVSGENDIQYFRVTVDGRPDAGNWMRASQLARINY
jgi:hypothetical protein